MATTELLEKVKQTLTLNPNGYYGTYKQLYQEVFGSPWPGCNCKSSGVKIKSALQDWYDKNKII